MISKYIVNASVPVIFCSWLHIWRPQNWSIYSRILKHEIHCLYHNRSEMCSGPLKISTMEHFTKIVNNVICKTVDYSCKKKLIWGVQGSSLGPECISADMKTQLLNLKWGYLPCNKQKDIILINFLHLKFRWVNYPSISESLKLSKVSAWCRYQECLFRKYYPQIIIEVSVTDVFLTNFHLLNIFF